MVVSMIFSGIKLSYSFQNEPLAPGYHRANNIFCDFLFQQNPFFEMTFKENRIRDCFFYQNR
jgi:hypothetical protein